MGKGRRFVGAPAPRDITEAAYGRRLGEKLRKATVERLLPCIVDGLPIPRDLVEACVRHACKRAGLETEQIGNRTYEREFEKTLGIACSLFRHHHKQRGYEMALERTRTTRDYLYGRLLALAERLEAVALNVAGEKRATNAARLMQRFADRPMSTWRTIETALTPYKVRLRSRRPGFLVNIEKELDEVFCAFATEAYLADRPLSGEFLLGYHCQRLALWSKKGPEDDGQDPDINDDEAA
jgi:CRISPR-associated protein Csd1